MSAPFRKILWIVMIDKTTMMAEPLETGFLWQHFFDLEQSIRRMNRDKHSPVELSGPFWSRLDAERFVRVHHRNLRRRVRSAMKNPS